jgi:Ca2+-binding RTX toxin-like protein
MIFGERERRRLGRVLGIEGDGTMARKKSTLGDLQDQQDGLAEGSLWNSVLAPEESLLAPAPMRIAAPVSSPASLVSGSFGNGVLSVFGDGAGNNVAISRNAAGTILVNGGAVSVPGGTPTVANTSLIQVFCQAGNDAITLNEASGALPRANLFGGIGNDTLTGGSGADMLFGQADHDTLLGKGGVDFLFGGAGNDVLTGGDGDDQVFGESGNDRMIWNPGDDSDLFEGGADFDTAEVNGGNGDETFTATANGARVRFDRLAPAPFSLDIGTTEQFVVNMNGGNDTFSATGNLASLIQLVVDGGAGNDTILGGNGADILLGGDGNDFVDGNQGNDVAFLGAGNDVFQWDPGDGNDVVEGQDGADTVLFNGSAGAEAIAVSANGAGTLLTRNLGNISLDMNGVETLALKALGGADAITVGDLTGTALTQVDVDIAGTFGGSAGDAQTDTVSLNGTAGADAIQVTGQGSSASVLGLAARVNVTGSEGALDQLVVNGGAGKDTINASGLAAGVVRLTIDGGAGDDTVLGSAGADIILGGDGNDVVQGRQGNDTALLGANDDVFVWNPGDGSDTVEGQSGLDRLVFSGSNVSENLSIGANGGRALLFRDVAAVTMDLNDVETIEIATLGGADNVAVGDLAGTDVTRVDVKLAGPGGAGDGAIDTVTVGGTTGDDLVSVFSSGGGVTVAGLQATVGLTGLDGFDRLVVNAGAGSDVIDATSLTSSKASLAINGGLGNDVILGSEGSDIITGGDGFDVAFMGGGDDVFVWSPGDDNDTIEGQAGSDTLAFNGSNAGESFTLMANSGRALLFRDVAGVTMDMNDVETLSLKTLGGADTVTINDMSGTDITKVNVDLGSGAGSPDNQADTIFINATSGDDIIQIVQSGNTVSVFGLAETITITGFDASDRLVINGLGGDDVIEASGLGVGLQFTGFGGDGNDVLIGGAGIDVLAGGAGDDVLIGGPGLDVLDGGLGGNVVIQSLVAQPDSFLI